MLDLFARERLIKAIQEQTAKPCSRCGHHTYQHGYRHLKRLVDVPQGLHRTYINLARQRRVCASVTCRRTVLPPRPASLDPDFECTYRLTALVESQCLDLRRQFTMIADDVGLSDRTLRDMFDRLFARLEPWLLPQAAPGTLRINPDTISGEACLVIENVTHELLVDILKGGGLPELTRWLQNAARHDPPRRILIPPDQQIYEAVHAALPWCRIALDPGQIRRELQTRYAATPQEITSVLHLYHRDFSGSKRDWLHGLRQVALSMPGRQNLAYWLKNWQEQLILAEPGDKWVSQNLTRSVQILNLLGNNYSFGRLRQRLLLSSPQVKAYHHRAVADQWPDTMALLTLRADEGSRYVYAWDNGKFRGTPVARAGIHLEHLSSVLRRALVSTTSPGGGINDHDFY